MLGALRDAAEPELRRGTGGLAVNLVCGARATPTFPAPAIRDMSAAMQVNGKPMRTIWLEPDGASVGVIDQTALPHRFATVRLTTLDDAARAIISMQVRGAPLIGAAAAYGMCLALRADASDEGVERAYATLLATRPTAINLRWALDMGARRDDGGGAQPPARGTRGGSLSPCRRDLR
jgi:hypothetical protein